MSKEEKGAHISAALMGHPVSEETRRKIGANTSEHLSGRKQSPEHVAKRTASRRRTMLARAQEQEK
jgi:hypothetical protein